MAEAISIEEIIKSYDRTRALNEVSLSVDDGELFGLIGPDGAGKSTLFRILTTLLLPDAGEARVKGKDVVQDYRSIREAVGYMPGRFSLYPDLSVEENLQFFATVFGTRIETNYDLIKDIYQQIEPFKERRAGALSGGMKQKLALSCALIHRPEVLFLDEPTTGVDPVARNELWDMLKKLKEHGITLFVSTPYMDEARKCDRIGFLQKGELLMSDTPERVEAGFPHPLFAVRALSIATLIPELRAHPQVHSAYPFGQYLHVAVDPSLRLEDLRIYLLEKGYRDVEVLQAEAGIEDRFMELIREGDEH
jgi:ABC-2 type transport system ATP-binding protein